MLTVICHTEPQVVCMGIYGPDKAKGLAVNVRGRALSIEEGVIYLDPCLSVLIPLGGD
jgi:hypothetical protein